MKIAILLIRTLRGSGFATRVSAMLESYASMGHEVDVFHYRFPHEEDLPSSAASLLRRYVTVVLRGGRYRRQLTLVPPLVWHCTRAYSQSATPGGWYDVVQAETANTWGIARRFPAAKRLAVLHDDDSTRLRGLAEITSGGVRRLSTELSARKYARWQRIVLGEADRVWFASEIERDRLTASIPGARTKVIPNGVGDELWSVPAVDDGARSEVLFVAPGFYRANSAGLEWFIENVWPIVEREAPRARVRIVGLGWERSHPHADVSFVGWREMLVEEYARARVVIAPLFAGGGTKLKVLEAMAAGRPVVTTPLGAEGIPRSQGVSASADQRTFASDVIRFLTDVRSASTAGVANRRAVEDLRWSAVWKSAASDLLEIVGRAA